MYIYTIIGSEIGYIGGNYKNDKPLLAANKAGKALFKKLEDIKYVKYKNKKSIKFVLKNKKDKINYCYEVFKKKNKKEFNYEIKKCVLSKNQLKKYTGGVDPPPSSAASSAQTQSDLGSTVRDFSPSTITGPPSSPNPEFVQAAMAYGVDSESGPLEQVGPLQQVPPRLLGSDPPLLEVGPEVGLEVGQEVGQEVGATSVANSRAPSRVQSRENTPENNDIQSPRNLSEQGSEGSLPTSSKASKKQKIGGNKIIKLLLSALPILQQNEIRTKYNIPKSHNSVDIILKNYNLKYNEETRRSTKNSIYYNIKIKDGKSKKYEPYSDKLDSKYFKLDISKK